ncbi:MAG: right-handed parallel beta-helix repeat-containing protein [Candidatus Lernaella stagnicola]|nr:right-handed parallel beta-helix repeat-containing protein [Candidatus Lernaella stagnicola]
MKKLSLCMLIPVLALAVFILFAPAAAEKTPEAEQPNEMTQYLDDLRERIAAANEGDTILVKEGVYVWPKTDEPMLVKGKKNLTIRGEGDVYIFCTNLYVAPLYITDSDNITVENMNFGHMVRNLPCQGPVVYSQDSTNVTIRNCVLHGSGFWAWHALECKNLLLENTAACRCSHSQFRFVKSENVTIRRCFLAKNDDLAFRGSFKDPRGEVVFVWDTKDVVFEENLFFANVNKWILLKDAKSPEFRGNTFAENSFRVPAIFLKDRLNLLARLPEKGADTTVAELLSARKIWPNSDVRKAAKRYLAFMKVFEKTQRELDLPAEEKP